MSEKITKTDFALLLSERLALTKKKTGETLDHLVEEIVCQLKQGKSLTLKGLGTFSVKERPARIGRSPATGKAIKIPAKKMPHFKAGKEFKESIHV